eukprot:m.43073 g.43073  ORF g.43073 m.43073 type:complete len:869 (+) comp9947_c0_seq1:259-2865(+)
MGRWQIIAALLIWASCLSIGNSREILDEDDWRIIWSNQNPGFAKAGKKENHNDCIISLSPDEVLFAYVADKGLNVYYVSNGTSNWKVSGDFLCDAHFSSDGQLLYVAHQMNVAIVAVDAYHTMSGAKAWTVNFTETPFCGKGLEGLPLELKFSAFDGRQFGFTFKRFCYGPLYDTYVNLYWAGFVLSTGTFTAIKQFANFWIDGDDRDLYNTFGLVFFNGSFYTIFSTHIEYGHYNVAAITSDGFTRTFPLQDIDEIENIQLFALRGGVVLTLSDHFSVYVLNLDTGHTRNIGVSYYGFPNKLSFQSTGDGRFVNFVFGLEKFGQNLTLSSVDIVMGEYINYEMHFPSLDKQITSSNPQPNGDTFYYNHNGTLYAFDMSNSASILWSGPGSYTPGCVFLRNGYVILCPNMLTWANITRGKPFNNEHMTSPEFSSCRGSLNITVIAGINCSDGLVGINGTYVSDKPSHFVNEEGFEIIVQEEWIQFMNSKQAVVLQAEGSDQRSSWVCPGAALDTSKVFGAAVDDCLCSLGTKGPHCTECSRSNNSFGVNCSKTCTCQHGVCNVGVNGDGHCLKCMGNYSGTDCDNCSHGYFGPTCSRGCDCISVHTVSCNDGKQGTGECICKAGFAGDNCSQCADGYFGLNCEPCDCQNGICDDGVEGTGKCKANSCKPNSYGLNCIPCTCDIKHGKCDDGFQGNGTCLACYDHYNGRNCEECSAGYFGPTCADECKCVVGHGVCDDGIHGTGECTCHGFFDGKTCGSCLPSSYRTGPNCDQCLPNHWSGNCMSCDCIHGQCDDGIDGSGECKCGFVWHGKLCRRLSVGMIVIIITTAFALIVSVCMYIIWRLCRKVNGTETDDAIPLTFPGPQHIYE